MKLTKSQIQKLHKELKVNTLYLFGSQAIGKQTALSDFDFAVILDSSVSKEDYFDYQIGIITELAGVIRNNQIHIDLIILNDEKVPLLLKFNVLKEGVVLMCKNEEQRVASEVKIGINWCDWRYFEELWSNIYLKQVANNKI